jgi:hypothetical protein
MYFVCVLLVIDAVGARREERSARARSRFTYTRQSWVNVCFFPDPARSIKFPAVIVPVNYRYHLHHADHDVKLL